MGLQSKFFSGDPRLEDCLIHDYAHIIQGAIGKHVRKIQDALVVLDGLRINDPELEAQRYGPSTAAAVLAYKTRRWIVNRSYQDAPDAIVGKMTMASLDREMYLRELPGKRIPRPIEIEMPGLEPFGVNSFAFHPKLAQQTLAGYGYLEAQLHDCSFDKNRDSASIALLQDCTLGTPLNPVIVTFNTGVGDDYVNYLSYVLSDAIVRSVTPHYASNENVPDSELVGMTFHQVEIRYDVPK